eukprot:Hpha_TRINITY_DN16952_c2_g2::TRINITY_DN16952_c2_g2_i1::g.53786::m.53786
MADRPLPRSWQAAPECFQKQAKELREAGYEALQVAARRIKETAEKESTVSAHEVQLSLLTPLKRLQTARLYPSDPQRAELITALIAAGCASTNDAVLGKDCWDAASTFLQTRNPVVPRQRVEGLVVPLEAVLCYLQSVSFAKCRKVSRDVDKSLLQLLTRLSPYLTEAGRDVLWTRFRPLVCPHNEHRMRKAWAVLLAALPVRSISQSQLDDVFDLGALSTSNSAFTESFFSFLLRLGQAQASPGVFGAAQASLLPLARRIFACVLRTVKYGPVGERSAHKRSRLCRLAGSLVGVIVRQQWESGDRDLEMFHQLLRALDSLLGPCDNQSDALYVSVAKELSRQTKDALVASGHAPPSLAGLGDMGGDGESDDEDEQEEAVSDDGTPDEPLPELRRTMVGILLPYCRIMLMNQRHDAVSRSGAELAQVLLHTCPEVAYPVLIEKARANAAVKTSSVGINPPLYKALLPQVLRRGTEEDQKWLFDKIVELLVPEHSRSRMTVLQCIMLVCASGKLRVGWQAEWGVRVGKSLVALTRVVEEPGFFTITAQLLAAAMPTGPREEALSEVFQEAVTGVHATEPKKNPRLRALKTLVSGTAATVPEWGTRLVRELLGRVAKAEADEAVAQWSMHLAAGAVARLRKADVIELKGDITKAVELFLFSDKDDQWRLSAGGALLKATLRALLEHHPAAVAPAGDGAGEDAFRPQLVAANSAVDWNPPTVESVAAAKELYMRWAPKLTQSVRQTKRWGTDGAAGPDAWRLLYLAKGAWMLLRQQAISASKDKLAGIASFGVLDTDLGESGWEGLGSAFTDAPTSSSAGSTERISGAMLRLGCTLINAQHHRLSMFYTYAAGAVNRIGSGVAKGGWKVLGPLPALQAVRCVWSLVNEFPKLPGSHDAAIYRSLTGFVGLPFQGTQKTASFVLQHIARRTGPGASGRQVIVEKAMGLIREGLVGEGGQQPEADEEHGATGALKLLEKGDFVRAIWQDWDLVTAMVPLAIKAGVGAREDLQKAGKAFANKLLKDNSPPVLSADATPRTESLVDALLPLSGPTLLPRTLAALQCVGTTLPPKYVPSRALLSFLFVALADAQRDVRSRARGALKNVLEVCRPVVPRKVVDCTTRSTTTELPTPAKVYDYSSPVQRGSMCGDIAEILDDKLLNAILSVDEVSEIDKQEELREKKASFNSDAAQVWKGILQCAGTKEFLERLRQLRMFQDGALEGLSPNSRQQAEVVGGLLRAMQHWQNEGDAAALKLGQEIVLDRLRGFFGDGTVTPMADMQEALAFGASTRTDQSALQDALLVHLEKATSQNQSRVVALIGRYTGGMLRCEGHIAFARKFMKALSPSVLHLEYEQVRREISVIIAYFFHLLFRFRQPADADLQSFLVEYAGAGDKAAGAKAVLGSVYSTTSLGRVAQLQPYLDTIVMALGQAVALKQVHTDGDEIAHLSGTAIRGLLMGGYNIKPLAVFLAAIPADTLSQRRGRKLFVAASELVVANAFETLADGDVQQALKGVVGKLLQGILADAAKDAAETVAVLVKNGDAKFGAELAAEYNEWARSDKVTQRKGAAGGLGGVVGANTYFADESTFTALRALLTLCKDEAQPVRTRASDYAARWRSAVKERKLVWADIEPELERRGLLSELLRVQATSSASHAYA